jgi:8-oxo-dGTP pyrophosphatase MutT (NUDIX family)
MHRERMLILKRKQDDERNPGKWDCVGGHFLAEESAEDCMLREAMEESGLDVKIKRYGRVFEYVDKYGRAVGVPFLLQSSTERVKLSEHADYRWVSLGELKNYDCVPEIRKALVSLKLIRERS